MVSEKVTVKIRSGIHARTAVALATIAGECKSTVEILFEGKRINAKSILNLMSAEINQYSEIEVCCEGMTEKEDLKKIVKAIKDGLGETK